MPDALLNPVAARSLPRASLWAVGLFFVALLSIFHETTWSMISTWMRSETFAHGFIILPISLWLMWDKRDQLRPINPRPAPWVALLIVPPGFVWLLGWLVDVQVVQQVALVLMLVIGSWAILGHQLTRVLAFPLLFLFFAVPMGKALVPPMMEFTASSTVWLIQQTGIPVYREGMYFTLPSGNWSVVEACSGVRYIIAAITLGVLYAYLTYRSTWRRVVFVLVSAIVPVLANTGRAYIIVMLGHLSDMTVATGVDHLIYGWVFFGLVIFLLFWLGSFWREDAVSLPAGEATATRINGVTGTGGIPVLAATAFAALLVASVWPLLVYTTQSDSEAAPVVVTPPEASGGWRTAPEPTWRWQPDSAVAGQVSSFYDRDGETLALYIQYAEDTPPEGDVVGTSTFFADKSDAMRVIRRDRVTVHLAGAAVLVDEAQLVGAGDQLLAWSWYRIGATDTSNDYLAKLRETWAGLGFGSSGSYRIVVALPLQEESAASTRALLDDFLDAHGKQLDEALTRAGERASQ